MTSNMAMKPRTCGDRIPGRQDAEGHDCGGHQDQREADSVETEAVVNGRGGDPGDMFGELHLTGLWIEEPPERNEQRTGLPGLRPVQSSARPILSRNTGRRLPQGEAREGVKARERNWSSVNSQEAMGSGKRTAVHDSLDQ